MDDKGNNYIVVGNQILIQMVRRNKELYFFIYILDKGKELWRNGEI